MKQSNQVTLLYCDTWIRLLTTGVFLLFFAGKPAVPAAVTLVCSPMMRGDKVVKNL